MKATKEKKKTTSFLIKLTPKQKEDYHALAKKHNVSLTKLIESALERI